jgi:1-acyl-sn-glycerol-3-phosphate acyltransferase
MGSRQTAHEPQRKQTSGGFSAFSSPSDFFYLTMRGLVGLALGFYFRRIERFHTERVPANGPLLFASNHPNSLTDSFVIGTSVKRKVNFVATIQLFRFGPLRWLLTHCGVIPINRVKDDPHAMRTVAVTFEACFAVLERGEAVGIFPEGITYEDSQLKEVKSGAARMALELEARHHGNLGLQIVPAGLTYSAKEIYRSDALVNFGEPLRVTDYLEGYREHRKECIHKLMAELERQIQALILHFPQLEQACVVEGVKRLYLDRLQLANRVVQEPLSPRAEELQLSQRIAAAVVKVFASQPLRAAAFANKLAYYERWLKRLRLADEPLKAEEKRGHLLWRTVAKAALAFVAAPLALYGWLHRLLPALLVTWAVHRFTEPGKRKAQTSTVSVVAGIVIFVCFYACYVWVFGWFFGSWAAFWYALTLPPASLIAYYYMREVRQLAGSVHDLMVLLRAPLAAERLKALRREVIEEIEAVRKEIRQPVG